MTKSRTLSLFVFSLTLLADAPLLCAAEPAADRANPAAGIPKPSKPLTHFSTRGAPPIFSAILRRDLPLLKAEIAKGVDLNARGPQGCTPLIEAVAFSRQVSLVEALLEGGAHPDLPDAQGLAPLYYTIWHDAPPLTLLLLDHQAKTDAIDAAGDSALSVAASFWRRDQIDLLLAHGASPLVECSGGGLIHYAAAHNDPSLIALLLDKGEHIDRRASKDGTSPLMWAARGTQTAAVRSILEFKPDLNVQDKAGWTALMHALWRERRGNADLLLAAGADATLASPSGETAYLIAAQRGYSDLLPTLISAGVSKVPIHLPPGAERLRELAEPRRFALAMTAFEAYLAYVDLGDFHRGIPDQKRAVQLLEESYGLVNAEQLQTKLAFHLAMGEHNALAHKANEVAELTEAEFKKRLDSVGDNPVEIVALKKARQTVSPEGAPTLLAWDLCHHNFLAALGARAGWLSDDEAWSAMLIAADRLRSRYSGWSEVGSDLVARLGQNHPERDRLKTVAALFLNRDDPLSAWTLVPFPPSK